MKRLIIWMLALLMALQVTAWAEAPAVKPHGAYIEKAELIDNEDGSRTIHLTLGNAGEETVKAVILSVLLLDDNKQPVLEHSADHAGFEQEVSAGSMDDLFYLEHPIAKGETTPLSKNIGKTYKNATLLRAGVTYWVTNSEKAYAPDKDSVIYTLSDGTRTGPQGKPQFLPKITDKEARLANSFSLGFGVNPIVINDFVAPAYGLPQGGLWITAITPDSFAEQLGLQEGDVLHTVAGLELANDFDGMFRAKARMAQGETVEFVWSRNGELMKNSMTLPK